VGLPAGPDHIPEVMEAVLVKRLTMRGFIVSDFDSQIDDFRRDVSSWLKAGEIKYKEDVVEGLENAPTAFIGLLKGQNFGKLLVKVSE
jgi:NADPH-dependent curcumin reductase CurA